MLEPVVENPVEGEGFIPGTTFKTPEELAKGYLELKSLNDRQGNELGQIRKDHDSLRGQTETLATILKENLLKNQPTPAAEKPVDYDSEITAVEKQIQELDPMDAKYQTTLASLVGKSNKLSAAAQHEKTLSAAGELMKKELSDRDVKAVQEAFYRENPEFNTPEMQAKIKEYIAKDRTGMSDPLSAFREIQRDTIAIEAKRLADENAEYKRLLDLNKGKDDVGKVVVKNQPSGQPVVKPSKVVGKDLDAGMMAVLNAQKAAS